MNTQTRRPWPETFIRNDTTPARILAFDADTFELWNHLSVTTLRVYSTTLLEQLIQLRERTTTSSWPIAWIVHSLGGLIIENALTISDPLPKWQQIAKSTIGAAFFATPHCGSDLFRWRSMLDNFVSYIIPDDDRPPQTFVRPDCPDFTVLQRDFETLLTKRKTSGKEIHVISWYEKRPMPGVGILVPENFTKILQYDNSSIDRNHMELAKCRSDDDQIDFAFGIVLEDIRKWIARSLRSNAPPVQSKATTSRSDGLQGMSTFYREFGLSNSRRNTTRGSFDESSSDDTEEALSGDSDVSSRYSWRRKKPSSRLRGFSNKRGSHSGGLPSYQSLPSPFRGYDAQHNRDTNQIELGKHTNLGSRSQPPRDMRLPSNPNPRVAPPRNSSALGDSRTILPQQPPNRQQAPRNHQKVAARSYDSPTREYSRTNLPQFSSRTHAALTNFPKAAAGTRDYTYSPISRPDTIRLLKLGTTESSSGTIRCQLESVRLDHAPPFFALSYCWGKKAADTPIICEDSTGSGRLVVTATLAQALRRLQTLSNVTSTLHSGSQHVGSINRFGEQLSLLDLKNIISRGFHTPRVRERLQELAEELPQGLDDKRIVAGYIRRLEISRWGSRFDLSDDPTGPQLCSREELIPVLDRLIQVEESNRLRAEVERGQAWDLTAKYFWIDQICINQSDKPERDSQVKLMGRLYSRAIRTLIWLGDDGGNSHLALNLAEKIANLATREEDSNELPPPVTIRRHAATGLPLFNRPEWPALAQLLSVEWFRRIWVVQEAILSPQDALVLYGHSVHSWTRLRQAASWLYRNAYEGLPISDIPFQVMNVDTFTQVQFQDTKWKMLAILDQTYNGFCATKPQDKLYGVLGLCAEFQGSQWPSILEPNYELPTETVFRNVARFSIESSRNLAVLSLVCLGGRCDNGPSWAPDLTGSPFYRGGMNEIFLEDDGTVGLRNRDGYRACLGFPLQLEASADPDILALRGVQVDTVAFQMEENYSFG
ncbi:hypothetical protein N431DRAFT_121536 [Stipitochalara longipes BDJ]|nr:hypothetical protein N431DRAFT_121536 [Stipitochalara longipes BDJ]